MGREYIPLDQIKSDPNRGLAHKVTTSGAIATAKVVYLSGLDGVFGDATAATNATAVGSQGPLYVTLQASNADGDTTRVSDWAVMTNLDTSGGSVGDPVYLSTAGGVTLTQPAAGTGYPVVVGRVISSSDTSGARTWVFDPKGETDSGMESAQVGTQLVQGTDVMVVSFDTSGGSTPYTATIPRKCRVVSAQAYMLGAGDTSDTVQIKNGANAITDAVDVSLKSDTDFFTFSTFDNTYEDIAAGGTLVCATGSAASCRVNVILLAVS